MSVKIIPIDRSIIPACDVNVTRYEEIVRETCNLPQIGGYKISAALALSIGIPEVVKIARKYTEKPLIYDHQKAATDIPETGRTFVTVIKESGIDALIIFPLTGPLTQASWIRSAQEIGLPIIVGGYMTHERYLVSEGGYIADDAATEKIYTNSVYEGIKDYVVPGNKPEVIKTIRKMLLDMNIDPIFYSPGFISQGGRISDAAVAAGNHWHAIVGRAIYEAQDIRKAVMSLASHL